MHISENLTEYLYVQRQVQFEGTHGGCTIDVYSVHKIAFQGGGGVAYNFIEMPASKVFVIFILFMWEILIIRTYMY